MEGLGLIWLFIIGALALLAILMPLFVYEIRNDIRAMRKLMEEKGTDLSKPSRAVKICPKCGAKNRLEDTLCVNYEGVLP
jgi:hypothetical protein